MREALEDGRIRYVYHGLSFTQNPKAPKLFAFVASSNELDDFCGVARKSEDMLGNYQRALEPTRVTQQLSPFFHIPQNCSPTAIVLSLRDTPICEVCYEDESGVSELDPGIRVSRLTLTMPALESLTPDQIIEAARHLLDSRLSGGDTEDTDESLEDEEIDPATEELVVSQGSNEEDTEDTDSDSEVDDEAESIDDSDEEEDESIEIGTSMLKKLRALLDDADSIDAEILDALRDMLKPALVIDGQHRLFGAAAVEEDIPFLVCSMINPDWKEQVFQFTVINDKAEGIPKPFITSLAGMSLTRSELDALRTRLHQAGVNLWEVNVMQRLGKHSQSPFCDLIDFKIRKKTPGTAAAGLGYATMKRVGKAWYEPQAQGLLKMIKLLYLNDPEKRVAKKKVLHQWQQSNDWFEYFRIFWNEVKDQFNGTPIWELHSNLLKAVVLEQFQAVFFDQFSSVIDLLLRDIEEDDEIKRRELVTAKFKEAVENYVGKFKKSHFSQEWGSKSLNHKDGKELLSDYFTNIYVGKSIANHRLVTGK